MYKVKLLPATRTDLRKAKKWYSKQGSSELGEEFKQEVNKEIEYIGNIHFIFKPNTKE